MNCEKKVLNITIKMVCELSGNSSIKSTKAEKRWKDHQINFPFLKINGDSVVRGNLNLRKLSISLSK